jgi:hypothetical protein
MLKTIFTHEIFRILKILNKYNLVNMQSIIGTGVALTPFKEDFQLILKLCAE